MCNDVKHYAAQEAVAEIVMPHIPESMTIGEAAGIRPHVRMLIAMPPVGTKLYAAPVAAAPVVDGRDVRAAIAGIEGSVAVGSDGEWVSVRRTARDAAVTALRNLSSDCAHIYAAYAEAKASTPAAPGVTDA